MIWFYIMLFLPKLWQSTLRNEMHCNLCLLASKGGFIGTAVLCSLPLTAEILLPSRRTLDIKDRSKVICSTASSKDASHNLSSLPLGLMQHQ